VDAARIADAWARDDQVNGEPRRASERREVLRRLLPPEVTFFRCPACGLEMAAPPVLWPSDLYPPDQSYPVRWEFQRAVGELGPEPLDVLELGCGTGEFLALALAAGHRPVGIDFSASAVAVARQRGLPAVAGGFESLAGTVGDRQFDAAVLFQVIEHLGDPDALFQELSGWLRPRARIIVACPGPRRYTRLITEHRAGESDFWDYPPQHVLRWTLPALQAFFTRHGWSVVSAVEEPFDWRAVGSHLGVARALYRGRLAHPLRRRSDIAIGWLRALTAPASRRAGTSIYVSVERGASR
jgi:SAM-dependent methyltransferase